MGKLTAADFGRLPDNHSCVDGPVRGKLFNARAFWLFRSVRNAPVSLVEGEWGARGSRALVRRFFDAVPVPPPLVLLLRQLCRELAVAPRRVAADAGGVLRREEDEAVAAADASASLGAGGSARVFCVSDAGEAVGALRALKVSATLSRAELEYEFWTLQAAAAAGAPVVPVVEGSLRHVRLDSTTACTAAACTAAAAAFVFL